METAIAIFWIVLKIIGWCVLGLFAFLGICVAIIALFPTASFDAMMGSDEEEIENKHYE